MKKMLIDRIKELIIIKAEQGFSKRKDMVHKNTELNKLLLAYIYGVTYENTKIL